MVKEGALGGGRSAARELVAAVTRESARAAGGVPGVAMLRQGLGEVVRGAASRAGERLAASGAAPRPAGVKARRREDPERWEIAVRVLTRRGHRAVDVARAVRAAVETAVAETLTEHRTPGTDRGGAVEVPVVVTVTVVGIA